jgi:hypothetical protein
VCFRQLVRKTCCDIGRYVRYNQFCGRDWQSLPKLLASTEERMRAPKLLMTVVLTVAPIGAADQHSTESAALAFEQLQSQSSAKIKQASERLVRLGKSDPKAREYVALHLPPLIEKGPQDYLGRWTTFVRLAGELKIAEAAPALVKWLTIDNIGEISTAGFMRLENNPAGAALVQIGEPAIPAVVTVFDHGTLRERRYAVYVLNQINSPSAKRALREQLNRESDENLKEFIQKSLPN